MNKWIAFLLILALFGGCNNKQQPASKSVSVSIMPQKFFVDQLAGEWLDVNVMIPPGASPATYEPTPKQMTALSHAVLYFRIGHVGFEYAWMEKLASVNPAMKIIDTSKGLDLLSEDDHDHSMHAGEDHHHHHGVNPHIWLSPELVKQQAEIIAEALRVQFPEKSNEIEENLVAFQSKCDSVQFKMDEALENLEATTFIVYHPVWTYLAKEYALHEISIEQNGKEATPDRLKYVVDLAKEKDIRVIFVQKEFSDTQAKTIANEIQGEVVHLNPLAYNWFEILAEFVDVFTKVYG